MPGRGGRAATQRPLTSLALTQKSGVPAWKTTRSWAVIGTADHAIPPAELLAMANGVQVQPPAGCCQSAAGGGFAATALASSVAASWPTKCVSQVVSWAASGLGNSRTL